MKGIKPGTWVEAKGRIDNGKPVVTDVTAIERAPDDKPDKLELLAPVTKATPTELELIGLKFSADETTEYENADKKKVDPFLAAPGDWIRVKARRKEESMRARTVRQSDAKGTFKLTGEFRSLDTDTDIVDIAGIRLPALQNAEVGIAGRRNAEDPLSLFLADDQKGVPFTIQATENLRLGGQLSVNPDLQDDYKLDRSKPHERTKMAESAKMDALWLIDDAGSYSMFEVTAGRTDSNREDSSDLYRRTEQFEVSRALASIRITEGLQLVSGRQDFQEDRRWLYNEVMDGVRILDDLGDVEVEIGAATGRAVLAENNPTEDTQLYEANLRWDIDRNWTASAYVLKRLDDTVADHEPLLYGFRSSLRPRTGLGYWLELGGAAGHSTFVPNGQVSKRFESNILGYAFDTALTYTLDAPLRPYFAAGYAMGTGAGPNANKQGYRQSGYQDNNGKLGGVTSMRYYGEVLRPELSNIGIATVATALRPSTDSAITFAYHHYIQDTPTDYSPVTDLRAYPNGQSWRLGYELDVVLGYRPRAGTTIELTAGRFFPGSAFDTRDPATRFEFTFRFGF